MTARRLLLVALLLGIGLLERAAVSDGLRLVKPEQYRSRIVAPKKGRVLVVNFWATWCEPCREEMPALVAASRRFPSKSTAFVLVSIDSMKTAQREVPKFLSKVKVPFLNWVAKTADPATFIDAVDTQWDGTVPYTLIYDRKGQIAVRLLGKQSQAAFEEAVGKVLLK